MFLQAGSEYALRALVELARSGNGNGKSIPLRTIAANCHVSEHYLYKLFHALSQKGILKASPGPKKGYRFAKEPEEITLLDVVSAVQGPLCAFNCVHNSEMCPDSEDCPTRKIFLELTDSVVHILSSHNVKELL